MSSFFFISKNKMKKSQVAIEFLIVMSIIFFLATFVLYDIFNKRSQIADTSEFLLKKGLCLGVSSFISGVYTKGSGTEAYMKVKGDQLSYNLTIQPRARNLFVGDKKAAYCTIPISSVSNSTEKIDWFKFEFDVDNRVLKFENIDNFVVVSMEGDSVDKPVDDHDTE